jgi:hypothetical protein
MPMPDNPGPDNQYEAVYWAASFFFMILPFVVIALIAGLFVWCLIFGPVG